MTMFGVGSVVGGIEGVGKEQFVGLWMDREIQCDGKIKSDVPFTRPRLLSQ